MDILAWITPELSRAEWIPHIMIFTINIGLLLFARPLLNLIEVDEQNKITPRIFRTVNLVILVLHVLDIALLRFSNHYENYLIKLGLSLASIYTALYLYNLLCFLSRKRFGNEQTIDDKKIFLETYSSRLVSLLFLIFIIITTIYTLIKIWGADSMLETTGIFGIIAAFLAFTSNSWAPDIISGLIILNSKVLQDGDVVVVDGYPDEYIINKVTLIYVVLYDVRNNHRTLIRNNQFIRTKIDNLSRVASTDGVRQALKYNIGYPEICASSPEERAEKVRRFRSRIDRMFSAAFDSCAANEQIKINRVTPFEWALTNTGDYALEYTLWLYLERIPNTKITSTIRRHLMGTIYQVNEAVFFASEAESLSLATPMLNTLTISSAEQTLTAGAPHNTEAGHSPTHVAPSEALSPKAPVRHKKQSKKTDID